MFRSKTLVLQLIFILTIFLFITGSKRKSNYHYDGRRATRKQQTKTMCMNMNNANKGTFRAKNKACFLRPDTGPCRADVIQWYFDVSQKKCYRFFWGGCQGNGNKFESKKECMKYCYMNSSAIPSPHIPYYCQLSFDYGSCFGHYNRWAWDKLSGMCRLRLYSGCGGNQNNFETREECWRSCLNPPNNTMSQRQQFTTCFPLDFGENK